MENKVNDVAFNINKELEDFKAANVKAHDVDKFIYVFYDEVAEENVNCVMFKKDDLLLRTLKQSSKVLPSELIMNAKDISIYKIGSLYTNGQFDKDVKFLSKLSDVIDINNGGSDVQSKA